MLFSLWSPRCCSACGALLRLLLLLLPLQLLLLLLRRALLLLLLRLLTFPASDLRAKAKDSSRKRQGVARAGNHDLLPPLLPAALVSCHARQGVTQIPAVQDGKV